MLKNYSSRPKLLHYSRTSTCFNHAFLFEKYDKTVRDGLSKERNVNFHDTSSTQLALSADLSGHGVSFASLLALLTFLNSAFVFLTTLFSETTEDAFITETLEKWLSFTNEQENPLVGTKQNWTQHVFVKSRDFNTEEVGIGLD